jgi:rhodanese-related sulfurtransferase
LVADAKTRVREISVDEYARLAAESKAGQLVDVREDSEWNEAHASGAVHLSKGVIERDIEDVFPNKDTGLVLYCGGGFRSALTADSIQRMGYSNVLSLDGGWRAILQAGLPIEIEQKK